MPHKKSFEVDVNPEVLKWAIKTAGWEKKELAMALKISESTLEGWLSGKIKPTIKQLEELSKKTKRPLAAFFLPKPPKEEPLPKDYRMIPDKIDKFDRKTLLAIRKARFLQEISLELSINLRKDTKPKIKKVTLKDDPKKIALFYREKFNLSLEKQTKEFKDAYKFYNYLREILEDDNILSFQISMPLEDARGFVLVDKEPVIIVVNSKDSIEARIFTLMHEFAHILLGESAIDIFNLDTKNKVEKWCNIFASEFLLPSDIAKEIFLDKQDVLTETKTLNSLSRKYKVSKAMLVYKMFNLKFIEKETYEQILSRPKRVKSEESSGVPQYKKRFSELGNRFISLVFDNLEKKYITYNDTLTYLSVKSKNLEKLMSLVKKW